jgi:peptidyl-prolyl cis-trans isomerase SDCCAG10
MRRDIAPAVETKNNKSALQQMIPPTSIRGRKRPRPGESGSKANDASTLEMLNAFKARLDDLDREVKMTNTENVHSEPQPNVDSNGHVDVDINVAAADDTDESKLCDLHFIANCQSCQSWDRNDAAAGGEDDDNDAGWMTHALSFEKDRLGKDLTWKRKNEEELIVIDPREKEREIKQAERERRRTAAKQ